MTFVLCASKQWREESVQNIAFSLFFAAALLAAQAVRAADVPPAWAFPIDPPDEKAPPDDGTTKHVPDSDAAFSRPVKPAA
jgi:hypothetical protein